MVAGRDEQTHTPPAYKTRNWPSYNEALKRRGSLTIWLGPDLTWEAAPTGKRRRQPAYSPAAIQTCLTIKVLFGMAHHDAEMEEDQKTVQWTVFPTTTGNPGGGVHEQ